MRFATLATHHDLIILSLSLSLQVEDALAVGETGGGGFPLHPAEHDLRKGAGGTEGSHHPRLRAAGCDSPPEPTRRERLPRLTAATRSRVPRPVIFAAAADVVDRAWAFARARYADKIKKITMCALVLTACTAAEYLLPRVPTLRTGVRACMSVVSV